MRYTRLAAVLLGFAAIAAHAADVPLGSAANFAVLGGATVTNTGLTVIDGNVGVWPGTAITGFPPGMVTAGTLNFGDAVAAAAHADAAIAYNFAAAQPCGTVLTGQDLGGLTLYAGVYCFAAGAQLTGTLTLDALSDPNAVFVFQIGSTLATSTASSVILLGPDLGSHVFWQVGSSATLATGTSFAGNILALASITLGTDTTMQCGRALALNGAVTLDSNSLSINPNGCTTPRVAGVPEPGTWLLLIAGFGLVGSAMRRRAAQPLPR